MCTQKKKRLEKNDTEKNIYIIQFSFSNCSTYKLTLATTNNNSLINTGVRQLLRGILISVVGLAIEQSVSFFFFDS